MIAEYFKISLKNLKKRKVRTALTLIGIIIAIATIFVLISISVGLQGAVEEQFKLLGSNKFFIQSKGQFGSGSAGGVAILTKNDVDYVKKIPGVKEVSYTIIASAKLKFKDNIRFVSTYGIDTETSELYFESGNLKMLDGRTLKKGDRNKIVLGYDYKVGDFLGKEIKVGDKIEINDRKFEVKGIIDRIGNSQDDRAIYLTEEDTRELFNITKRIDFITVQIEDGEDLNEVADRVEKKLTRSRGLSEDKSDISILTPEELLESFGQVLTVLTVFLLGIAGISLVVGGIGIANTMYTSVLERRKEIGIMKAIGAKNSDVLKIFLVESGLIGLSGGIIGIILGVIIAKGVEFIAINSLGTTLLQAAIPPNLIIGCLAFAFGIGAFFGAWPAWQASRLKPVDALRYE